MNNKPLNTINENEDYSKVNVIDMDIDMDIADDDDFGGPVASSPTIVKKAPITTISADINKCGNIEFKNSRVEAEQGFNDFNTSKYNPIDLEMDYDADLDDDMELEVKQEEKQPKKLGVIIDLSDDDEDYDLSQEEKPVQDYNLDDEDDYVEPELVSEELLDERKGDMIDQADVENDYLQRLAKRHKKTNVKGSYNKYFHIAGNPEKERELFNHDMTPQATPGTSHGGSIPTSSIASTDANADSGVGVTAGVSMAFAESKENNSDRKLLEKLLFINGFDLKQNEDGKYLLVDLTDINPEVTCDSVKDALVQLRPYINDSIITPLQYNTNQTFTEPEEWVNWYTDDIKKQYPRCDQDINYCKMLINLLK